MTALDRGSANPRLQCGECGRWMRLHGKDHEGKAIQRFYGACENGNDHPCGKDVCSDCCPTKCRMRASSSPQETRRALEWYADQYCEGWCECDGTRAKFEDCGGCLARRALSTSPAPAETDDQLAQEIHRVAGCQVGSERTKSLIAWYRSKQPAPAEDEAS